MSSAARRSPIDSFECWRAPSSTLPRRWAGKVPAPERRELALLYVSRLIFLSFLETKGWLNGDFCFLANTYADCVARRGGYQKRVLEPLFFGTLNTRVRSRARR